MDVGSIPELKVRLEKLEVMHNVLTYNKNECEPTPAVKVRRKTPKLSRTSPKGRNSTKKFGMNVTEKSESDLSKKDCEGMPATLPRKSIKPCSGVDNGPGTILNYFYRTLMKKKVGGPSTDGADVRLTGPQI